MAAGMNALLAAFLLLTRLPVPARDVPLGETAWAWPLVGAVVGGIGGLVYGGGAWLGLPPLVASAWALAAMLLATGALHEDGLADTADALGGRSRERRLEIMRDSRVGGFGAMALIVMALVRVGTMATLAEPWRVVAALSASGALARAAMMLVPLTAPPVRRDGLAAGLVLPPGGAAIGLGLAALAAFALLPPGPAALSCLAALAVGLAAGRGCRGWIGGHTGDVLGATATLADCVVLSLLAR